MRFQAIFVAKKPHIFCSNDVTSSGHSVQHKVSLKYKKPDPPDQYRQSSGGSFYYISESVGPLSLHFSGSARGRTRCSGRYRLLWTPELRDRFWSGWHSAGYSYNRTGEVGSEESGSVPGTSPRRFCHFR